MDSASFPGWGEAGAGLYQRPRNPATWPVSVRFELMGGTTVPNLPAPPRSLLPRARRTLISASPPRMRCLSTPSNRSARERQQALCSRRPTTHGALYFSASCPSVMRCHLAQPACPMLV